MANPLVLETAAYWLACAARDIRAGDETEALQAIEQALLEILPELPKDGAPILYATVDGIELAAMRRPDHKPK